MYEFIRGILKTKTPVRVVIEAAGVGYDIAIPLSSFVKLPDEDQEVCLWIHFHVREDAHQLFGFADQKERSLYRLLLSVSGIGPKLGLTILSGLDAQDLAMAIGNGDIALLTGISGVGKKTAERMIIELKDKVVAEWGSSKGNTGQSLTPLNASAEDTVSALTALGYKRKQAEDVVRIAAEKCPESRNSVEDLLRAALRLGGNR